MKKRGTPILYALAVVLAATLAGCAADDLRHAAPGQEETVRWRISINNAGATRGEDGTFPGGETTILDASIYFFHPYDGRILRLRHLTAEEIASVNNREPLLILSVPAAAQRFFMVANSAASGVNIADMTTLDGVLNTQFGIGSQMTDGVLHSAEKVIMKGMSDVFTESAPGLYEAGITIAPLMSRLEIGPISAQPVEEGTVTPGDVVSFTVSGIYLNYFYTTMNLHGATSFFYDNPEKDYTSLNSNYATTKMFDIPGAASVGGTASPAAGDVWAYQFIAPYFLPHIIVEMNDIVYSDGEGGTTATSPRNHASGTQYLTIQSYNHASDGTAMANALPAHVYKISRLEFDADNLSDNPYEVRQLILATLEVAAWSAEAIDTEYD